MGEHDRRIVPASELSITQRNPVGVNNRHKDPPAERQRVPPSRHETTGKDSRFSGVSAEDEGAASLLETIAVGTTLRRELVRGALRLANASSLPSPSILPGRWIAAVTANRLLHRYGHRSASMLIVGICMMARGAYLCHLN